MKRHLTSETATTTEATIPASVWADRAYVLYRESVDRRRPPSDEFWSLIYSGLCLYGRRYLREQGRRGEEILHDVAAEKVLDLIRRFDQGVSEFPSFESSPRLRRFLGTLIRNGIVDHLRRAWREKALPEEGNRLEPTVTPVESGVDARRYADAAAECVRALTVRARTAWLLRTFHEWPSRDIARHPEVASTPAAVDMLLARVRPKLTACLRRKGLDTTRIPRGTYVYLWSAFHGDPEDLPERD